MTLARQSTTLYGGCHCGSIRVELTTVRELADTNPRACDCSFCQKHGAAYISDPSGVLRVVVAKPNTLHSYRQGSEVARFQLCGHCGVLVAVTLEHKGRTYGAVNVGCLDEPGVLGARVPASAQLLSPQEKISRWLQVWVPYVQLVVSGA